MKKHIANLSMLTLCAAAIFVVPASSRAQDTTNAPAAAPVIAPVVPPIAPPPAAAQTPPVKKHTAAPAVTPATLPFHGALTAMDTNAMTLTVEKRTLNMTSETIVTKDDKPAVLADGVVGWPVRGAYKKNAEGKLDAVTVRFGAAAGAKKKELAN